uniref:Uncharacterized protein n=1 Tax=Oryza nivara TaxID=4536 RepID=A0A0E0H7Q1_ORYNI
MATPSASAAAFRRRTSSLQPRSTPPRRGPRTPCAASLLATARARHAYRPHHTHAAAAAATASSSKI